MINRRKNVTFLDLDVKILDRKIFTDLHIKEADTPWHLHYTSPHSYHTKRSIVYSQALRVSRIYPLENDFIRHRNNMECWFLNNRLLINMEVRQVKYFWG